MSEVKLGKPKYERGTKNYFSFKKDQNHFVLRILPPMGRLAEKGKWSMFHRVEFGHVGTDGRMKPFISPRVVNYQGNVEVESESHVRRVKLKEQFEAAKAAGNVELANQCKGLLQKYNQDAKHYMNVVDLQGNVGLFKIGHRGFTALKAEIDRLRGEGVDPIGIENGRFFSFSRSGRGTDTLYTVKEYKQKQEMTGPDGNKIVVDVPFSHNIDSAIMSKLSTDAFELDNIYPTITAEEESRIISEGASAVDLFLGNNNVKENKGNNTPEQTQSESVSDGNQPSERVNLETTNTTVQETPQTLQTEQPSNNGQLAESTPTAGAGVTATPTVNSADLANMDEADFFDKISKGNF